MQPLSEADLAEPFMMTVIIGVTGVLPAADFKSKCDF